MAKKYYHNVTRDQLNETDVVDLIESMHMGDIILWSETGNACVHRLTDKELGELQAEVSEFYKEEENG